MTDKIDELRADFDASRIMEGRAAAEAKMSSLLLSVREPETYRRHGENSYFADLLVSSRRLPGAQEADERLRRHAVDVGAPENRALDTSAGNGGAFVPPKWLLDQYIPLARAGRAYADLAQKMPLPEKTGEIRIPKILVGTDVAAQNGENTAIEIQDIEETEISAKVRTIAGGQDVSLQLLEQSPGNFDELIFGDLAAAYAVNLDKQVLAADGTNRRLKGVAHTAGIQTVAINGPVTIQKFYAAIANAINKIHVARMLSPTHIVMHPRRWAWITGALDGNGRPLVLPPSIGLNSLATLEVVGSQQVVGELQGLPVVTDPNLSTTAGGGEIPSEDLAYVQRSSDLLLSESGLKTRVLDQIGGKTLTAHLQVYGYAAFTAERYPQSIVEITGLTAPDFGG